MEWFHVLVCEAGQHRDQDGDTKGTVTLPCPQSALSHLQLWMCVPPVHTLLQKHCKVLYFCIKLTLISWIWEVSIGHIHYIVIQNPVISSYLKLFISTEISGTITNLNISLPVGVGFKLPWLCNWDGAAIANGFNPAICKTAWHKLADSFTTCRELKLLEVINCQSSKDCMDI